MAKVELPTDSSNERTKLSPVVNKDGLVRTKKTVGQKFKEVFFSEDVKDVKSYIWLDVIVPTIKNTILNVGEMIFFGTISGGKRYGSSYKDRKSYDRYYRSSEYNGRRYDAGYRDTDRNNRYQNDDEERVDYREIVLRDRIDAEKVVRRLRDTIDTYERATVADLLDLIDETSTFVDNNWGWTNKNDIGVRRVSSGYLIDVAEAKYLN